MTGLGKRIRETRKRRGLTQTALAEAVGVRYQTIQDLESGKSGGSKHLLAIARGLDVDATWLETGNGLQDVPRDWTAPSRVGMGAMIEIDGGEFARIPIYDIRVAAGVGAENHDETPIDHYLMSVPLLRAVTNTMPQHIAGLQIMGDSMESTLHNLDWALIDMHQTKLTREGIYALNFEGAAIIKRASQHLETGAVTLTSDNPNYPAQTIKKPARLHVIGRMIISIRRH